MSLKEAIEKLQEKFGKDCISKLGDVHDEIEFLSTGSILLDRCIGGGWPFGRIVEVFGPEGGGKTTLALHSIVEAQKKGLSCAFIDTEHSLNLELAESLGVKIDKLYFSQPDFGEQALEILHDIVKEGIRFVVVDSVASLTPKAEIDGDFGDTHMGLQARLMSQAMRKLVEPIKTSNSIVIFLNQIRMKITNYGNPETTTGGNALKFYSSVRVDLRKRDLLEKNKEIIGHQVEAKVVKNKVGPPFRKCTVNLLYGTGLDNMSSLISLCVYDGILTRKGPYLFYGETNLGQGDQSAKETLEGSTQLWKEIVRKYDEKTHVK